MDATDKYHLLLATGSANGADGITYHTDKLATAKPVTFTKTVDASELGAASGELH